MSCRPAILGGDPVRREPIPEYNSIGPEEKAAVQRVMDRGLLSGFYGSNCDEFYGGPEVRAFESEWAQLMRAPFAVSVNSATSGLFAAVAAVGVSAGDEVIVSPYTMSATAAAILAYRGIPVFADIDPDTFCLDPNAVESAVTPQTKAVIVTHLFGHPADMDGIMEVADRHGLAVIEDCAQSPGATVDGQFTGLAGDIGVFSLNCHKIIQTGEGGMCITKDKMLAEHMQLVRNHGEAVIAGGFPVSNHKNLLGYNYRMTEIQAAIGREQLKKLMGLTAQREGLALRLSERLSKLPGVQAPFIRKGVRHGWYVYAVLLDEWVVGISRERFAEALTAEGFPTMSGYMAPLYDQPVYRKQLTGLWEDCVFSCGRATAKGRYFPGMCPVTEDIQSRLLGFEWLRHPLGEEDMDALGYAFEKVLDHRELLREGEGRSHAASGT